MDSTLEGFISLGQKINKFFGDSDKQEGAVSEKLPELKLTMENSEIIRLTRKWKDDWEKSEVCQEWKRKYEDNEKYWKGKQFEGADNYLTRPLIDNVIFEALETYLPQVTRRNPEPLVIPSDKEDEKAADYSSIVKNKLGDIADEQKLRLKLKKVARFWSIYLIGVGKVGWDLDKDIPTIKPIRPKKLILDPESTIDEDGYDGRYIGEYRKMEASLIVSILESADAEEGAVQTIKDKVKGEMGTEVQFIEWWTPEYMVWTLDKEVLLKKKNTHWNYDTETQNDTVDEYGTPVSQMVTKKGQNHLAKPKIPFVFLSIFNLGTQPVDDTSLIGQNLSNQDLINKRLRQMDKNIDDMNGGIVVSLERSGMTKEQASGISKALRRGGTVVIPQGTPRDAVDKFQNSALPPDVYNQLVDTRNRTRDIFGTRGSTPAGLETETTVRGKLMNRGLDTDRIGGGISEYLEQFADDVYNWFVQLLYVYDDTDQFATMANKPKVIVSVKEGSLLPKDSTTIANQAIELAAQGKMSTLDLYKRLDFPDAETLAANAWLEQNAPQILYAEDPRVAQALQMQQQAAANQQKPPSVSMSYKDLPPDGQVQAAAQAGIQISPESALAQVPIENAPQ